eukprot:UN04423
MKVLSNEWYESVNRSWRLLQLKLIISRSVLKISGGNRERTFSRIDKEFHDLSLFKSTKGFQLILEVVQDITQDSAYFCRALRLYLQRFILVEDKPSLEILKLCMDMIDENAKPDFLKVSLTDVCKVQLATHLIDFTSHLSLGKDITSMLDKRP